MLTNILYIFLAIVMLGVIVTAHEFGHYLVGRLCGIGIALCGFLHLSEDVL